VGACDGARHLAEGVMLTAFILAANTLLRPLVNAINRIPFNERTTEATHTVRLRAVSDVPELREAMVDALAEAKYPVADLAAQSATDGAPELVATLINQSVHPHEMDAVVEKLGRLPGVRHASWESSTTE
jgi:putative Mg2+ transporter-C (MgtC) family protein